MTGKGIIFNADDYYFVWNESKRKKYYADEIEDAKYIVSVSYDRGETWETLGLFNGMNRSFEDDTYYLNYWDSDNHFRHKNVYYYTPYWSQLYTSTLMKLELKED